MSAPAPLSAIGDPAVTAVAPYDLYRSRRVFGSLDGLRALSIAAVVWHHTRSPGDAVLAAWIPAARLGFLGVDLFFVLSGFLIVTLLLRERERSGEISLPKFYTRRALRIFPLYYGLIAAFTLLYWARVDPRAEAFRADLPYLLLYLSNWHLASGSFAVTWSLAAEEQFYLLWPPVERFLRRGALGLLATLIGLSQVIHFGWADPMLLRLFGWSESEPAMLRETTFTPICLGVLLAHVLHRPSGYAGAARFLATRWAAPASLLALLIVPQLFPPDIRGWPRLTVHVLMLLVVATSVVREDHALARFYAWRPLARVGAISYGIYLLHHVAIGIAERGIAALGGSGLWALPLAPFVLGGLSAIVLAELSFRFYERPFLSFKERYAVGRSERDAVAPAPAHEHEQRPDP
jgi:peptidoglycan/LPS O-acetylase OafA/YrhL